MDDTHAALLTYWQSRIAEQELRIADYRQRIADAPRGKAVWLRQIAKCKTKVAQYQRQIEKLK